MCAAATALRAKHPGGRSGKGAWEVHRTGQGTQRLLPKRALGRGPGFQSGAPLQASGLEGSCRNQRTSALQCPTDDEWFPGSEMSLTERGPRVSSRGVQEETPLQSS